MLHLITSTTLLALQFSQSHLIQLQVKDRMCHTEAAELKSCLFFNFCCSLVDSGRANSWSQEHLILSSSNKGHLSNKCFVLVKLHKWATKLTKGKWP